MKEHRCQGLRAVASESRWARSNAVAACLLYTGFQRQWRLPSVASSSVCALIFTSVRTTGCRAWLSRNPRANRGCGARYSSCTGTIPADTFRCAQSYFIRMDMAPAVLRPCVLTPADHVSKWVQTVVGTVVLPADVHRRQNVSPCRSAAVCVAGTPLGSGRRL